MVFSSAPGTAQTVDPQGPEQADTSHREHRATSAIRFAAGAALALGAHEAGHLVLDVAFNADPSLKRVDFHGIPFVAITHRPGLAPRREFAISSAGFVVQHVANEWILTRRPALRARRAPFAKGIVAFNVLASTAYAGAAFARTGPYERDTRGMADAARIDERWTGALILAPAALDAWRYFHPEARWAAWTSRGVKAGMLLLLIR